jgi:hypothetical protein
VIQASLFPRGSAILSDCGRYRYELTRELDAGYGEAVFVMVNPSTADSETDDATIRRCASFARRWRCTRLRVVNLFAWRATDVRDLLTAPDPVGHDNDATIFRAARTAMISGVLVFAWGTSKKLGKGAALLTKRATDVRAMLPMFEAHVLGWNADGSPTHPLFVPGDRWLERWPS